VDIMQTIEKHSQKGNKDDECSLYIHIYIYIHIYMHTCIYI